MIVKRVCTLIILVTARYTNGENNGSFPDTFLFGVAISSYQSEGAWNVDGKSESIWDAFTHKHPSPIKDGLNGDVACDSYHRYKEDIALAAGLGLDFYRFSISWSRVLPTGYDNKVNEIGLQYYKNLVAEIRKYNMIPVATIYHWDLPNNLVSIGWDNLKMVDLFVNYSRVVIKNLPDVGVWLTINEPKQICHSGYGDTLLAPAKNSSGLAEYMCAYVVLKAHAETYHMYKEEFKNYTAKMSIVIDCEWYEPLTSSAADKEAAQRFINFECGIYAHPIYIGDWPIDVKFRIDERSLMENYNKSRLPELTLEEINYIQGTADFFALNTYFTYMVNDVPEGDPNITSFQNDVRIEKTYVKGVQLGANGFPVVPWGVYKILKYIKNAYNDPVILITEMGFSEYGLTLEDDLRILFFMDYFNATLEAMFQDGVQVIGIAAWSLLDNFEWVDGYSAHFGFYYIDFTDPNLTRIPKKSVKFFKKLVEKKSLPILENYQNGGTDNKIFNSIVNNLLGIFIIFYILFIQ
ncbi:myrosinase 1-like isoform X2 [Diorhabda carinulata]|uniref:myrosinase 1-like isoform X2 n=1 Tax=Diorhabda carinulata TaxID=1163345 RepID=UPI0025A0DCF4|nr:myrosinase 1-like isoform X2 [Diorhabda carinulata]